MCRVSRGSGFEGRCHRYRCWGAPKAKPPQRRWRRPPQLILGCLASRDPAATPLTASPELAPRGPLLWRSHTSSHGRSGCSQPAEMAYTFKDDGSAMTYFREYNKEVGTGDKTLVGNWVEERALRDDIKTGRYMLWANPDPDPRAAQKTYTKFTTRPDALETYRRTVFHSDVSPQSRTFFSLSLFATRCPSRPAALSPPRRRRRALAAHTVGGGCDGEQGDGPGLLRLQEPGEGRADGAHGEAGTGAGGSAPQTTAASSSPSRPRRRPARCVRAPSFVVKRSHPVC